MVRETARRILSRLNPASERNLADTLRTERAGGMLLLVGTVVALAWANSPWSGAYLSLRDTHVGPESWHLHLSLADWAKDGLLAIFFFVVGLELKREFVTGTLRRPATAVVPIVAAVGGMAVPALLYLAFNAGRDGGSLAGWAVPTATDIAFAVAVLAVVGRSLPNALRAFLLTLAVVDDLLAIIIIAVFFSDSLNVAWLAGSLACVAVFWFLARSRITHPLILVPLALAAWVMMHASGVHATIAGVALGLAAPAIARRSEGESTEGESTAERWEHIWRPVSAGLAVPIFALFAAGVTLSGAAVTEALRDPVSQGIGVGLVLGKPIGILLATWLVATFTRAALDTGLSWWDVLAVAAVAGIGFTVSLLIGDLAFDADRAGAVKMAVLLASALAALLGAALLYWRDRHYRSRGALEGLTD